MSIRKNVGSRIALMVRLTVFVMFGLCAYMHLSAVAQEQTNNEQDQRLIGFETGSVDFAPYISQRFEYDSNIFREENGEEEDFVSKTSPGFNLAYPGDRLTVNASASTVLRKYADTGDVDDDLDFSGSLDGTFYVTDNWYISAGTSYDESNSPLDFTIEDQLTTVRTAHQGGIGRDDERLEVELLYRYQDYEVDDIFDGLDWTDRGVDGSVTYSLNDPFRVRAGVEYGTQEYDEGLDNDYGEVTGGLQWNPNRTFGAIVDAGYRNTDYSSDENYDEYVLRGTALWRIVENGRLKAQYSHQPKESTLTNFVKSDELMLQYDQMLTRDWTLSPSVSYDRREEADADVIQDTKEFYRISLNITWSGLAEFADLTGGYRYTKKATDDGVGEYDLNIVSLEGTVRF